MYVNAHYQCYAVTTHKATGRTAGTRESVNAGTLACYVTREESARHAAWKFWRDLADRHNVHFVQVEHVEYQDNEGRWHLQPLAFRFQGADLRADCPAGSPHATA